jgi:hypothetical protein
MAEVDRVAAVGKVAPVHRRPKMSRTTLPEMVVKKVPVRVYVLLPTLMFPQAHLQSPPQMDYR